MPSNFVFLVFVIYADDGDHSFTSSTEPRLRPRRSALVHPRRSQHVGLPVAVCAQGNEVFLRVRALVASEPEMVDLEIGPRPAALAAPAIALQNLPA